MINDKEIHLATDAAKIMKMKWSETLAYPLHHLVVCQ